jgi:hypothetical protein
MRTEKANQSPKSVVTRTHADLWCPPGNITMPQAAALSVGGGVQVAVPPIGFQETVDVRGSWPPWLIASLARPAVSEVFERVADDRCEDSHHAHGSAFRDYTPRMMRAFYPLEI